MAMSGRIGRGRHEGLAQAPSAATRGHRTPRITYARVAGRALSNSGASSRSGSGRPHHARAREPAQCRRGRRRRRPRGPYRCDVRWSEEPPAPRQHGRRAQTGRAPLASSEQERTSRAAGQASCAPRSHAHSPRLPVPAPKQQADGPVTGRGNNQPLRPVFCPIFALLVSRLIGRAAHDRHGDCDEPRHQGAGMSCGRRCLAMGSVIVSASRVRP